MRRKGSLRRGGKLFPSLEKPHVVVEDVSIGGNRTLGRDRIVETGRCFSADGEESDAAAASSLLRRGTADLLIKKWGRAVSTRAVSFPPNSPPFSLSPGSLQIPARSLAGPPHFSPFFKFCLPFQLRSRDRVGSFLSNSLKRQIAPR